MESNMNDTLTQIIAILSAGDLNVLGRLPFWRPVSPRQDG